MKTFIVIIIFCTTLFVHAQDDNVNKAPELIKHNNISNSTSPSSISPSLLSDIKSKPITPETKPTKSPSSKSSGNKIFNLIDSWKQEIQEKIIEKLNLPALPYLMASYNWKNNKIYNIKIGVTKTFNNTMLGAEYHFDSGTASLYLRMSFSTSK